MGGVKGAVGMLGTGLVSVSFRKLGPEKIIALTAKCGLEGIEWGGDIHVPHGEIALAREIGRKTREAGLAVACYGSYYRLTDEEDGLAEKVVETAQELGAPLIRVWAGTLPSADAEDRYRERIAENFRSIAQMAGKAGMEVACEYHGGTLTDNAASALELMKSVNLPNAGTLWQPPVDMSAEDCVQSIRTVKDSIRNIHVFSWDGTDRLPLAAGEKKWRMCLNEIAHLPGDRRLMMEFVRGDSPEQLAQDAACLQRWLRGEWSE